MNYIASIQDFFKSPKWVMNLLFAGLCVLSTMIIPVLGFIVLAGWLITGLYARQDDRFETFPDFDFNQFSTYLQRGLWPTLVLFVAGFVIGIVMWIIIMIPLFLFSMILGGGDSGASGILGALLGLISLALYLAMFVVINMVAVPLGLRATLMQDFAPAFDFGFVKRFVTVMWKEILISTLFLAVAGMVLTFAGMIALCVGMFASMALVYFASMHLSKQMYQLYLSRGGDPIPVSPKLTGAAEMPPQLT
jgi:hypothetical protein